MWITWLKHVLPCVVFSLTAPMNPLFLLSSSQCNPLHVLVSVTSSALLPCYCPKTFVSFCILLLFADVLFFLICSAFDLIGPPHYNATSLTSHTFWLWLLGFGHTEVYHRPEFFASFVLACCLWRCLQRTSISRTNCFCTGHSLHFTITLLLFFCNKNKSHVCTAQKL